MPILPFASIQDASRLTLERATAVCDAPGYEIKPNLGGGYKVLLGGRTTWLATSSLSSAVAMVATHRGIQL